MDRGDYKQQNRAKASFDTVYTAPTPHRYLNSMRAVDYRMADCMNPYLSAVVDASIVPQKPVNVLDVGCSYGMSGALLKTGCTYRELVTFYQKEGCPVYASCVVESRGWLDSHGIRKDVRIVGFDSSREAVRFATASHMIDQGITCDLEKEVEQLTADQANLIQGCDVLLSTGAIGYVTDKTVNPILDRFGTETTGTLGPVAVISVLELFDPAPISEAFVQHGYRFEQLPVRLPQRRFVNEEEREDVFETLEQRGVKTDSLKMETELFARLCIAAKPERFHALSRCVNRVATHHPWKSVAPVLTHV